MSGGHGNHADNKLLLNCILMAMKYHSYRIHNNETQWNTATNRTEFVNSTNINNSSDPNYTSNPQTDIAKDYRDFMTECLRATPIRPYEIPWEQKLIWATLFGLMLLIGIIGNCIVIWIVIAHREMRTITNYFLLNLSIADLMMSCLNCVFNFIYMLNSDWPFGSIYCSINNFVANVTVAASVFTLIAISLDRYVAIVRPLHRRPSKKKARCYLITIWSLSSILSIPHIIYSSTESKKYYNQKTRTICYLLWPDGKYPTSTADYVYNIIFLVITYAIPVLLMIICYSIMGRELWGSKSIGEMTERQREAVKSKKKVVKMFIVIVLIFIICWMPYHLFYIYAFHNPKITSSNYVPHLFLGFYWLAMSNTMVNPIIYYWMNRRFRHHFQVVMCFCCVYLVPNSSVQKHQDIYLPTFNSMSIDRRNNRTIRRHHNKTNNCEHTSASQKMN